MIAARYAVRSVVFLVFYGIYSLQKELATPPPSLDSWRVVAHSSMPELDRNQTIVLLEQSIAVLPTWMGEYLEWHAKERESVLLRLQSDATNESADNKNAIKYLVVRCLEGDKCGGVSDRFKPLSFFLMVASMTKRVLLLYWEKPARLEHFLQPPTTSVGGVGINWSINGTDISLDEIRDKNAVTFRGRIDKRGSTRFGCSSMSMCVQNLHTEQRWNKNRVINMLLYGGSQITKAEELFNRWNVGKVTPKNRDVLPDLFRLFFEPTAAVAAATASAMKQLGLAERQFTSVHVRVKAPRQVPKDVFLGEIVEQENRLDATENAGYVDLMGGVLFSGRTKEWIVGLFSNAISCAVQLSPGQPIYLASDTTEAVNYMVAASAARQKNSESSIVSTTTIVAANRLNDTLHVDYDGNIGRDPSEFYHTFVDMIIMSKAKCMSRGTGGFGILAERIGRIEKSCTLMHRAQNGDANNCSATI